MDVKERDQYACSALVRHRDILGNQKFDQLVAKVDKVQQNQFQILSTNFEDKDFHLARVRSKNGVSFGMIPNSVIGKVLDKTNKKVRVQGSLMLKKEVEDAGQNDPDKFALLMPYIGSFVKFLGDMLHDQYPKVR